MRIVWLFIFILIVGNSAIGQGRADKLYERGDYLGALKQYRKDLEAVGEKEGNDRLKARIANCFFHLNDVVRAGQMYKSLNEDVLGAEDLLFYAMTLQRSGEYDKALPMLEMIEGLGGDVAAIERLRESCLFAEQVRKEKPVYSANKTTVDFEGFSSGVTYYKGKGIILAAPGEGESAVQDSRGYKFTRLYNAVFTGDGKGGRMIPFADGLVDKYHIGAVTFTKDFNRIFYTKTILKKDGSSTLKLLTASNDNGKWGNIEELDVNSDDYSCAQPCLYQDSLLFFVSDMPGGIGGKDIYMTVVDGAHCGDIHNLGDAVNTPDDELFPFIDATGRLYFSSNGHVGLGGLDVFVSQMAGSGWTKPENMGRPINSSMDDFGLVFADTKCSEGYVSSNRGGTGYNDFLFSLRLLPSRNTPVPKERPVIVPNAEMFTVDYRYAIQIGAFRNPVPRVYFNTFQNVKVYLGFDNIYRYTVGEYPETISADNDLVQVRGMVRDAFVVDVDKYVGQRKIQNDVKGDVISDDELLLRRLKNFELMKQQAKSPVAPYKRFLNQPQRGEIKRVSKGYTIALMSVNEVFDANRFDGIDEIDVHEVEKGKFMYCMGIYTDVRIAEERLNEVRRRGCRQAYIISREDGYLHSGSGQKRSIAAQKDPQGLKELLNY